MLEDDRNKFSMELEDAENWLYEVSRLEMIALLTPTLGRRVRREGCVHGQIGHPQDHGRVCQEEEEGVHGGLVILSS